MYTRGTFSVVGALGADPEIVPARHEGHQDRVRLSVSQHDGHGQTQWAKITCFGRQAEIAMAYCRKGVKVVIDGRLKPYTATIGDRVVPMIDLIADWIVIVHSPQEERPPQALAEYPSPDASPHPTAPSAQPHPNYGMPAATMTYGAQTWGSPTQTEEHPPVSPSQPQFQPRTRVGAPVPDRRQQTPHQKPPPLGVSW